MPVVVLVCGGGGGGDDDGDGGGGDDDDDDDDHDDTFVCPLTPHHLRRQMQPLAAPALFNPPRNSHATRFHARDARFDDGAGVSVTRVGLTRC